MQFDATNLEAQLREFRARRFLAFPLAGTIAWLIVGVAGFFFSTFWQAMTLFIATGSIAYLGLALMRVTGEHVPRGERRKNTFDTLFFLAVAIPFFIVAVYIVTMILLERRWRGLAA